MSGPFVWWANRKSRLGMQPSARKPPHLPGKEWWTDPPTMLPQPEHIEYVVKFHSEVMQRPQTLHRDALLGAISAWMKFARRLLHEEYENVKHGDVLSTDGLILAVHQLLLRTIGKAVRQGYVVDERDQAIIDALHARAHKLGRIRAEESCKRVSVAPWTTTTPRSPAGGEESGGG